MPEISIIVPIFNEESSLETCLQQIKKVMSPLTMEYEVLVIDDGSIDQSWALIKKLSLTYPNLRAIRFTRNFGKESAIVAGLHEALGDAAIIMDVDLQHPPELIPEMIELWNKKGVFIVEAVKEKRQTELFLNRMGAKFFYNIFSKTSNLDLKNASDFKLLDREVIRQYLLLPEKIRFFRGLTTWFGFKKETISFIPSNRMENAGTSRWSFIKLANFAKNSIVSFTAIPMQLITILGIIVFAVAVVLGIQTLLYKFCGKAVEGFTTVILIQLGIGSILMLSLGIIGEYLARIYEEIKSRPMYLVSEVMDKNKKDSNSRIKLNENSNLKEK